MGRDRGRRVRSTEAWWRPEAPTAGRLSGKVEWDQFSNGATEISLYVRKLPVADGGTVEVVRDDEVLLSSLVQKGKARRSVSSEDGGYVPELRLGESVSLQTGGRVLARATVERD